MKIMHKNLLTALALLVLLTGCATTEPRIEYIRAECEVPPVPYLGAPDYDDLMFVKEYLDEAGRERFDKAMTALEQYERRLVDYTLVLQRGFRAACGQ
jgi:hypothetical protein